MRSLPQERPAEEELCSSLLRIVQDNRKIEQLREDLSGFSHRCRNLLNGMKMSLYFVRRGADRPLPAWWADVEQSYGGIEQLLDRLQVIYRPMTLTLVRAPFRSLVQDHEPQWRDSFGGSSRTLAIVPPAEECSCAFDPMLLSGGFDAFLRWRASMLLPGQRARLSWRTVGRPTRGVLAGEPGRASIRRGIRTRSLPGAGDARSRSPMLALPLLARVVTAHQDPSSGPIRRTFRWISAGRWSSPRLCDGQPLDGSSDLMNARPLDRRRLCSRPPAPIRLTRTRP